MANAVYTLSFSSLVGSTTYGVGDAYTVEIWSKATNTNPAIAIKGSDSPLKINWRSVSDIFEPVISSEAVVEVYSESDLYWKDFFTADRGDWILKVIRNGTIIWQGQNVTESYNEPYLVTPYPSTLRFSDLGDMDFIYYQPTPTTFYTDYQSLAEIIFRCTNKLEFQLDANEYTNCINLEGWNNASVTDKSLLCNTFLDSKVFRKYVDETELPMTCGEVLKSVLTSIGCRMFQASENGLNGVSKWHIQKIDEMPNSDALQTFGLDHSTYAVTTSSYTNDFARSITNGKVFYSPTLDICPTDQNQDLNMSERYNKVVYTYTTQENIRKNAELIFNHGFDFGVKTNNGSSLFPKYFDVSADISATNICQVVAGKTVKDKNLLFRTKSTMPGMLFAQGTYITLAQKYMYAENVNNSQGHSLSDIQLAVDDNLRFTLSGTLQKGVDYYYAQTNGMNTEGYITAPAFMFGIQVVLTYDNGSVYSLGQGGSPAYWHPNNLNVWTWLCGTNSFENNQFSGVKFYEDKITYTLDTPKFPQNGIADVSFRFYVPRTYKPIFQPLILNALTVEEMSLRYVTDGDFSDEINKTVIFFTISDSKENVYNFDVLYGDGPAEIDISSFRYGVVTATNKYKKTSSWRKLDDATALTASNLFNLIPAQKLISAYQRVITGDYIGIFDIVNTLNIDDGVDDKRYLIMGDNWDVKGSVHSLTMQEITEQSISVTGDPFERLFGANVLPTSSLVNHGKTSNSTLIKSVNNAVLLNGPATIQVQNKETKYPG